MTERMHLNPRINRWRWGSLAAGILGGLLCVLAVVAFGEREIFFRAYLFAWMICLELALGGMSMMMIHNLTGGEWGRLIRRVGETTSQTLPLLVILFIPLIFGLPDLFPWARPDAVAADPVLQHRQPYLNVPFFFIRAAVYFAIWIALAFTLNSWQRRWDRTQEPAVLGRIRGLSGAGLIIYTVVMTQAGVDWIMSRDVQFYSTAFGLSLTTGQTLFATAFAVILIGALSARNQRQSILAAMTSRGVRNDVGNILLTMVILWSYVTFMQFLVIWMGNTQEDNGWFVQRGLSQPGPWRWVGLGLIVFHFFVPFFLLLFRGTKQYTPTLVTIACMLLIAHVVDVYWLIAPSGIERLPRFSLSWVDLAALIAVFGVWFAAFLWLLPEEWSPSVPPLPEPPGKGVPARE